MTSALNFLILALPKPRSQCAPFVLFLPFSCVLLLPILPIYLPTLVYHMISYFYSHNVGFSRCLMTLLFLFLSPSLHGAHSYSYFPLLDSGVLRELAWYKLVTILCYTNFSLWGAGSMLNYYYLCFLASGLFVSLSILTFLERKNQNLILDRTFLFLFSFRFFFLLSTLSD